MQMLAYLMLQNRCRKSELYHHLVRTDHIEPKIEMVHISSYLLPRVTTLLWAFTGNFYSTCVIFMGYGFLVLLSRTACNSQKILIEENVIITIIKVVDV